MKLKLFKLALICSSAIRCAGAPPMPDIEIKLIDVINKKAHIYLLPKRSGDPAKYLSSEALSLLGLDHHFAMAVENYAKLEEYASEVEAYAKAHCR